MVINTKADFDNLIDRIRDLVEKYENNVLHYNQYLIYLANGEKISFEVPPEAIAHLLGIRLDYLRSTNLFKNNDAYLLLKELLENSYSVYRNVQEGYLAYNLIFSNYIEEKLESFEKIIYYFSPDEIEFICKYDKSRTFQLGFEKNYPCDYFIAKRDKNGNLHLLGLVHQGNSYMPMSNLYFPKDDTQFTNLKGLLLNQIITYPNAVLVNNTVTNFSKNSYLPIPLKLEKVNALKKYAGTIKGVILDVSYDLQYILNGYLMKDNKINAYKLLFQQFMETIRDHEIFSLEQIEDSLKEHLDSEMIAMFQTYNNEICKSDNSKAQTTYSDLLEKYNQLEVQFFDLQQQLNESRQEASTYYEQVQALEQENAEYKDFQEEIFDVVRQRIKKQGEIAE